MTETIAVESGTLLSLSNGEEEFSKKNSSNDIDWEEE